MNFPGHEGAAPTAQPRHEDGTFAAKTGSAPEVELDERLFYYQREVVESFERSIQVMTDMAETAKHDKPRIAGKRDGLMKVWERQGDRIRNAKSLRDLAAIIEFIELESPAAADVAEGEREGEALAVSYLRQLVRYLPDEN